MTIGRYSTAERIDAECSLQSVELQTHAAAGVNTVTAGDGTAYTFENGALQRVEAAAGERVTLERTSVTGKITRITHSNGLSLSLTYRGDRLTRLDTPVPSSRTR